MKIKSAALASVLMVLWAWPVPAADMNVEILLLDAFKAEKNSPSSAKTIEKFEDVLKQDPENYYALIKMGLVKMGDPAQHMDAVDYLLRAALAKPDHPEAYHYLAQQYYKMGYMNEGDNYLNKSRSLNSQDVYDSICLLGWRYEDTGNFSAAVRTYAKAALASTSQLRGNPYLMKRLYESVLASSEPYDWSQSVFKLMQGETEGDTIIRALRASAGRMLGEMGLVAKSGNPSSALDQSLRTAILDELRSFTTNMEQVPDRPELPKTVYRFFFCNPDDVKIKAVRDPYEAFAAASIDSAQDQKRVLGELQALREEALREISKESTDKEKAQKLFTFLKRKAITEYDALEGYSAKGIVDDKKFISLDGTILYFLIARDAKLNVTAYMERGHAYPVLNMGRDQKIRIELTADANEGFDFKLDGSAKFVSADKGFREGPFQYFGEISDPVKLIAFQYRASADYGIYKFVLNDNEPLFRQALKSEFNLDYSLQSEMIGTLRTMGIAGNEMANFWRLVKAMAARDDRFRQALINRFDRSIALLKKGREVDPFDRSIRDQLYSLNVQTAGYESLPAEMAVAERLQRRMVGISLAQLKPGEEGSLIALEANAGAPEAAQLVEEERERWSTEKQYWIKAVERIAAAARENPCDEKLKGLLAAMRDRILNFADKHEDIVAADELRLVTAGSTR
ncbi:MAG: hypothetical protein HY912_08305 [Desulfomonile tiedjei]|uniref:Tetratricopeptide repeat protein n=1 Tax=Desulfomonile tiedjei TaxID=2358 RepID=A0A9D6Z5T7_9BACT|nr:hypothetical protein [Desulfomonile tiedjei]